MTPTTRAASRRHTGASSAVNTPDLEQVAQPLPTIKTGYPIDDVCRFLDIPAELRNCIYDYAAEDFDDLTYAPRVSQKACKPWNERIWQFFGLTQTCRQIRAEFGSIWLLKLNVRSSPRCIDDFINTFVYSKQLLSLAPRRVQIEWHPGVHDGSGDKHDLTRLVQLHTHNLSHSISFVPEKLVDGWGPDDLCLYCINEFEAEERGEDDFPNWVERCTCAPEEDMDHDEWASYSYELISRTDDLLAIIRHNNQAWQQDVRSEKMEVQCIFGKSTEPITFRILCKERFCEAIANDDASVHAKKSLGTSQQVGHSRCGHGRDGIRGSFQVGAEDQGEGIRDDQYRSPGSAHQKG